MDYIQFDGSRDNGTVGRLSVTDEELSLSNNETNLSTRSRLIVGDSISGLHSQEQLDDIRTRQVNQVNGDVIDVTTLDATTPTTHSTARQRREQRRHRHFA